VPALGVFGVTGAAPREDREAGLRRRSTFTYDSAAWLTD
jgi:hypothetical protein